MGQFGTVSRPWASRATFEPSPISAPGRLARSLDEIRHGSNQGYTLFGRFVGNGLRAVPPDSERHGGRSLQCTTTCYHKSLRIEPCPKSPKDGYELSTLGAKRKREIDLPSSLTLRFSVTLLRALKTTPFAR